MAAVGKQDKVSLGGMGGTEQVEERTEVVNNLHSSPVPGEDRKGRRDAACTPAEGSQVVAPSVVMVQVSAVPAKPEVGCTEAGPNRARHGCPWPLRGGYLDEFSFSWTDSPSP